MENTWHALTEKEIFQLLKTSKKGLTEEEAKKRLEKYGLNELKKEKREGPIKIFLNQFKSFLIIVLIAASMSSPSSIVLTTKIPFFSCPLIGGTKG